ncbi:Signal peptidase I [Candidatus Hepatincolaceae symbiont of Richtersius coronifer]
MKKSSHIIQFIYKMSGKSIKLKKVSEYSNLPKEISSNNASITEKKEVNTPKKTLMQSFLSNSKSLIIALLIALLIRSFIVQAFYIPSGSMKPGLLEGDYVFVTKFNYGYDKASLPFELPLIPGGRIAYTSPKRGDVVVFKVKGTDYVKRLIGLPGDRIQVINSVVYINNKPLIREKIGEINMDGVTNIIYKEYMNKGMPNELSYNTFEINQNYINQEARFFGPIVLRQDEFFMMGDNRDNSMDSRFSQIGIINKSALVGKGWLIFFSINGSFIEFWKWFTEVRVDRMFKKIS